MTRRAHMLLALGALLAGLAAAPRAEAGGYGWYAPGPAWGFYAPPPPPRFYLPPPVVYAPPPVVFVPRRPPPPRWYGPPPRAYGYGPGWRRHW